MKKALLSLAMLTVISTPVLAKTPVANLKINGDIKPPTCTVNGATQSDVIFNLGKISPTLILNHLIMYILMIQPLVTLLLNAMQKPILRLKLQILM